MNSEMKSKNDKDELTKKFDELIKPYACYITDMEFKNANKPEISEIEKSLDIINQENDIIKKLIDEEKNLDDHTYYLIKIMKCIKECGI